jgi:Circularly permutated YpsA SLOG family
VAGLKGQWSSRKHKKPRLHLYPGVSEAADKLRVFVQENSVKVLNVAGPRASKESEVVQFVTTVLDKAFGS